jgi:hypothetical protein
MLYIPLHLLRGVYVKSMVYLGEYNFEKNVYLALELKYVLTYFLSPGSAHF